MLFDKFFLIKSRTRKIINEFQLDEKQKRQGFYWYRNNRLIHAGGWAEISKLETHLNIARASIELPSSLDRDFGLTVGKYKFKFAHVFGVNSIFSYSLSSILTVVFYSSKWWGFALNDKFINLWESIGLPLKMGSLVYALFYVIILWVPTYYLYKNKVFIKL